MTARITADEARALLDATHPDGCPPECSGSCVGAALRLDAHGARLARAVIALEASRDAERKGHQESERLELQALAECDELRAEVERLRAQRDAIDADREALTLGVWSAVHRHADGMPPLDTPRDRGDVIAAVEGLRRERDEARTHERAASERARILRGTVRHVEEERDVARLLAQRARDDRHEAERRAILAEQARTEAVRERDEARDEVERLRSVVEGRTTPPTDEEVAAIVANGGWWQCGTDDGKWGVSVCAHPSEARHILRDAAAEGVMLRWWAHDRTGRPCAWPTVGGAR